MKSILTSGLVAATLGLGAASVASAAVIQFDVTGYVTEVYDYDLATYGPPTQYGVQPVLTGIGVGDSFTLRFTMNSDLADINQQSGATEEVLTWRGMGSDPDFVSATVTVAGQTIEVNGGGNSYAELQLDAQSNRTGGILAVWDETYYHAASEGLDDYFVQTEQMFLNLAQFDAFFESPLSFQRELSWTGLIEDLGYYQHNLYHSYSEWMGLAGLRFSATSLTVSTGTPVPVDPTPTPAPVPLPAGFPLLAAGLGAFALLRRRKAA
ncbi:MAG: VPLPA-CTERM sorting domain-containing protein [Paracoccus sp. (in: a-proteobacteria)]|uniref:VPLPA-CTERM sorting domain-containing protein n=1 Tax=Paracoccus sp. TaxID=267 RepID=UPI0026DF00AD|nr:VPLPA-CTERM sorting domain-containing protein [Paracoccus sp. (in: a-proteobacteria)]MDO5613975.1 VPLPA-CTERM sorting domain-containing protein [Paracoccus sp. (in: a-proteobacteria)]